VSLETATYIASLVTSNPDGSDQRSTADDHLRLIKACLKRSFPLLDGAVSASAQAVTYTNDLTSMAQAQFNALRDGSATAFNALFANSASYAAHAGLAQSASWAISASYAINAGHAQSASWATSASYALNAGHALSASFATLATNALSLGGIGPGGFGQLAVANSWTAGQAITQSNTSGTTLTPNCAVTTMIRHAMTAGVALTIGAPSSPRSGMVLSLHLINGGNSTASWNAIYKFAGGVKPTLSSAAGQVDVFAFQYDNASLVWRQAGIAVA
jgi:hypothetical protein